MLYLISIYRASYFTPIPTGKMYAVVEAAKALYEQLGDMGESSIDGDSFLDLWIYVIIKAGVKDLVCLQHACTCNTVQSRVSRHHGSQG